MAAKTVLAARRANALESLNERLKRIGAALDIALPEPTFPKLPDELHRATFQMEHTDRILAAIEKALIGETEDEILDEAINIDSIEDDEE